MPHMSEADRCATVRMLRDEETMTTEIGEQCDHGVTFDEKAAKGLTVTEIRKRWPRGWFTVEKPCPKGCDFHGIAYASYVHYTSMGTGRRQRDEAARISLRKEGVKGP